MSTVQIDKTYGEAERWVIGSILIAPWESMPKVRPILKSSDFTDQRLRAVYDSAIEVMDSGMPPDMPTVLRRITQGVPEHLRDIRDLARCCHDDTPSACHVEYYARCMVEDACRMEQLKAAEELRQATDETEIQAAMQRITKARDRVTMLTQKQKALVEGTIQDTVVEYLEALHQPEAGKGNIPTIMPALDKFIGGPLPLGSYVILGACPGNGKTLFMLQMLRNASLAGHRCVFYSQEMSAQAIGERIVTMTLGNEDDESDELTARVEDVSAADVLKQVDNWLLGREIIFRQCDSAVTSIITDIKRQIHDIGATVFAIDYLGLLTAPGKDRYQQMTAVNAALKNVASTLNVTLIVGCQLNRAVMNTKPPIPQKHHLRDSGEIEAAADAIFLLRYPCKDTDVAELRDECMEHSESLDPKEYFQVYIPKLRNRVTKGDVCVCRLRSSPLRFVPLRSFDFSL